MIKWQKLALARGLGAKGEDMRFDLMICDLDGTLLDTATSITVCLNRELQKAQLPQITVDETKAFLGNGSKVLVEKTLALVGAGDWPEEAKAQFLSDYDADYLSHPIAYTKPYEGISELLAEAKRAGLEVAVFSNKPDAIAKRVIQHFFGDLQVRGQRPDTPKKPDPTGLNALIEEAGVPRERVLYVGDTEVDAQTGENAGVETWLVTYGFRSAEELKDVRAQQRVARVTDWAAALRKAERE